MKITQQAVRAVLWTLWACLALAAAPPGWYTLTAATVRDKGTGLTWQRVVYATASACQGDAACQFLADTCGTDARCTWSQAGTYCNGLTLAGASDWRLPSKIELETIVDDTRIDPAIDATAFPNTPALGSVFTWTSTPSAGDANNAWVVVFVNGGSGPAPKADAHFVRCVR